MALSSHYRKSVVIDGGRVYKWLEGRTGLAFSLRSSVELALVEIASANHGQNAPRLRV